MAKEFKLTILETDSTFYDGNCISLVIPTSAGQYGVLAHHANMVAAIVTGTLKYTVPSGEEYIAAISGGLLKIEDNNVLVLADSVESPEEIDVNRAEAEMKIAREELLERMSYEEYRKSQAQIARAINRLKVRKKYLKEL